MTAHPSFPCTVGVDWNGGTSYSTIGQTRDIEGPGLEREEIEVAPHHGLANNYKQFFFGVSDAGELAFPINLDPNSGIHVEDSGTGLVGSFKDVWNGTSLPRWQFQNTGMQGGTATWVLRGAPTGMDINMGAVQGSMEADVTVKLSGEPILTLT